MKRIIIIAAVALVSCGGNNAQKAADALLEQANQAYEQGHYEQALRTIDSLRNIYPNAIETRKKALTLYQDIELKRAQEDLARTDSALQAIQHDYEYQRDKVEKDKAALRATPEELQMLTLTKMRRDSLQVRFDMQCAKIKYIHKKQKGL